MDPSTGEPGEFPSGRVRPNPFRGAFPLKRSVFSGTTARLDRVNAGGAFTAKRVLPPVSATPKPVPPSRVRAILPLYVAPGGGHASDPAETGQQGESGTCPTTSSFKEPENITSRTSP